MSQDDIIYALLLVLSLPMGFVLRKISGQNQKRLFSSGIGVIIATLVCGWDVLHALTTSIVNALILKFLSPKISPLVSFIWCFGYIVFFRTTHYLGLPKVVPHANAVQLLLTLKLVGLAFEIHDSYHRKIKATEATEERENDDTMREIKFRNIEPSFLDMLCYSSCFVGLLTGPYYRYRTYVDMLQNDHADKIDSWPHMINRLKWVPITGVVYLLLSHFIYIEYMHTDEFYENPFWYRLWYMVPMFTVFRVRMYFAWLMSELVCMAAMLGAYPADSKPRIGKGPNDLQALHYSESSGRDQKTIEYDFETIHNIDMWGCEFAPNVRLGMRAWNMSVQYWLATNVYHRIHIKPLRATITMAVSAFWHGIHPGYYLSFLTIPPCMAAETAMAAAFRSKDDPRKQRVYDFIAMLFKQRFLETMAMGFLLLRGDSTLRYWSSIYFLPHLVILAFLLIGNLALRLQRKTPGNGENTSSHQKTQ